MSALASAEPSRSAPKPEAAATQLLYERYSSRILGFCLNRLGSREEAEDAMQTTFLKAQRGLRRGVVPEFEAAWLYKIAENVCRTRYDRARRRPQVSREIGTLQDVLAAPERAEPDLIASLPDAIARMPPAQRRALLLREWQGLTYREIAHDLDVSESAVETLLYRARRSLTANLEQPKRRGRLSRVDLGSVIAFLKSVLPGGAAKVVVAAVAVTAAATTLGTEHRSNRVAPALRSHAKPAPTHKAVLQLPSRRARPIPRPVPIGHRVTRSSAADPVTRPAAAATHPASAPPPTETTSANAPRAAPSEPSAPAPAPTAAPPPVVAPPPSTPSPALPQSLPDVPTPTVTVPSPPDLPSLPAAPVQLPTVTLPATPALPAP